MKILIAGGGIGGLTAALCCLQFGNSVTVLEQSAAISAVGAGLQLSPNAMKVFRAIGLEDAIAAKAFTPQNIQARMGISGREIFSIPLAEYALDEWDAPYYHIHRAALMDVLLSEINRRAPGAVITGEAVEGYQQTASSITAVTTGGREYSGDILIGADGIKSAVAAQMRGVDSPVFTGNVAWRAVVPLSKLGKHAPDPTACVWMGRGRHAVTYRLGDDLVNFVGVVEHNNWQDESWTQAGEKAQALRDFEGWHPVIQNVIKSAKPDNLFRWALFDRPALMKWTDNRAVLLGDAAHAMLPFLAQGAAMAIEDAYVLARELKHNREEAFAAYKKLRFTRTSQMQAASRANMKTFHKKTKFTQGLTYGPMWFAAKAAPKIVHQRMNWIYGHDVTQTK